MRTIIADAGVQRAHDNTIKDPLFGKRREGGDHAECGKNATAHEAVSFVASEKPPNKEGRHQQSGERYQHQGDCYDAHHQNGLPLWNRSISS